MRFGRTRMNYATPRAANIKIEFSFYTFNEDLLQFNSKKKNEYTE